MIFRPELAKKVMAGEKTVTRRPCSDNPRSPWCSERCKLVIGNDYAVCPGRGKPAIGRVRIVSVTRELLHQALREPGAEGFDSGADFVAAWEAINGRFEQALRVWRVEFEVVR